MIKQSWLKQADRNRGHFRFFHAASGDGGGAEADAAGLEGGAGFKGKGVFIAGELGGMGLIKNGVEQGKQAVENIVKKMLINRVFHQYICHITYKNLMKIDKLLPKIRKYMF